MEDQPPEVLMRGLLRAYYWMDESLQNGLQQAGFRPRTRTQTMILIHISNGDAVPFRMVGPGIVGPRRLDDQAFSRNETETTGEGPLPRGVELY